MKNLGRAIFKDWIREEKQLPEVAYVITHKRTHKAVLLEIYGANRPLFWVPNAAVKWDPGTGEVDLPIVDQFEWYVQRYDHKGRYVTQIDRFKTQIEAMERYKRIDAIGIQAMYPLRDPHYEGITEKEKERRAARAERDKKYKTRIVG